MSEHPGILILHLHAHLPYVRHPEHSSFMEEDWLFEAISETYVPLLISMDRLMNEDVPFKLSMTLSPPLCEMLDDDLLRTRYAIRLDKLVQLGEKEIERTNSDPAMNAAAKFHLQFFKEVRDYWRKVQGDLISKFRYLQNSGHLEIMTCCATHGFLPHIANDEAIRAQLRIAANNYRKHFHRSPNGIWLAECAYRQGLDELLAEEGYSYTFLDAHGILYSEPAPKNGVWGTVRSPSGITFIGRDIESSKQVWSANEGYPGDPAYREFYRDVGYDREQDYIEPFLHGGGTRHNLGYKYYRITGDVQLDEKQPYDPTQAAMTARQHAENFHFNRTQQFKHLRAHTEGIPVVLAPYDAELFGHWWFEGPNFLESFMRLVAQYSDQFVLGSGSDACDKCTEQLAKPSASSWGAGGYFSVWLNESNQWMYPHLHEGERRMIRAASCDPASPLHRRIRDQMGRELLLAQSSDWAFIATTATTVPYAVRRFREHISALLTLDEMFHSQNPDVQKLEELEDRHRIFPEIDTSAYTRRPENG